MLYCHVVPTRLFEKINRELMVLSNYLGSLQIWMTSPLPSRMVRRRPLRINAYLTLPYTGPDNNDVTNGNFADAFRDRIGKTHFLGQPVQSGQIWKAKGKILNLLLLEHLIN